MKLSPQLRQDIIKLALAGVSKSKAASKLGVGRRAVDRWYAEAKEKAPNVQDKPRIGRPPKFNPDERKAMRRSAAAGANSVDISRAYAKKKGKTIHSSTVRGILKQGKKCMEWKPVLKRRALREANKLERVKFCRKEQPTRRVSWVFMDSKAISATKDRLGGLQYAWQDPKKPLKKTDQRSLAYFHFYGAVAKGHKSKLIFVPPSWDGGKEPKSKETFKSMHYVKVMKGLHEEFSTWYPNSSSYAIIRDRASQHIKAEANGALSHLNLPINDSFPAQSWDINCIEHVWAQLARRVRDRRPRTAAGLKRIIKEEWEAIEQITIDKLVAGVPERLKRIGCSDGSWIDDYKL
jgi:transposase